MNTKSSKKDAPTVLVLGPAVNGKSELVAMFVSLFRRLITQAFETPSKGQFTAKVYSVEKVPGEPLGLTFTRASLADRYGFTVTLPQGDRYSGTLVVPRSVIDGQTISRLIKVASSYAESWLSEAPHDVKAQRELVSHSRVVRPPGKLQVFVKRGHECHFKRPKKLQRHVKELLLEAGVPACTYTFIVMRAGPASANGCEFTVGRLRDSGLDEFSVRYPKGEGGGFVGRLEFTRRVEDPGALVSSLEDALKARVASVNKQKVSSTNSPPHTGAREGDSRFKYTPRLKGEGEIHQPVTPPPKAGGVLVEVTLKREKSPLVVLRDEFRSVLSELRKQLRFVERKLTVLEEGLARVGNTSRRAPVVIEGFASPQTERRIKLHKKMCTLRRRLGGSLGHLKARRTRMLQTIHVAEQEVASLTQIIKAHVWMSTRTFLPHTSGK